MIEVNEEELRLHAEHMMQASDRSGYSYDEVVRILTVANYVADLCTKEIEDRGLLTWLGNDPIMPDARPESMFISNVLTRPPQQRP
jgi:hypothetical protein